MQQQMLNELQQKRPDPKRVNELIEALEKAAEIALDQPVQQQQLEGTWELRWCSSKQPYLQVQPWLQNLQILLPSQGRGMNLLRLQPPFAAVGLAVEAELQVVPPQRVQVRFQRGGLIGPQIADWRTQLLTGIQQRFPAWLDITVLSDELRVCRGQNGTLFALVKRPDISANALIPAPSQSDR